LAPGVFARSALRLQAGLRVWRRSPRHLTDVYLGFYVDCDIQNRRVASTQPDDLTGYFDGAMRDPQGAFHHMQVGWMKDAAATDPLPGVFGVVSLTLQRRR